jgi:hypothetical protein
MQQSGSRRLSTSSVTDRYHIFGFAPVWDMAWLVAAIFGGRLTIGSVNNCGVLALRGRVSNYDWTMRLSMAGSWPVAWSDR